MKNLTEKISASLLDDLSAAERAELETLLAADASAKAEFDELTAMSQLLADHHKTNAPAPTLEQRMVAGFRAARDRVPPAARLRAWLRLPAVFIPAAAAILLSLVGAGSLLTGESPSSARPLAAGKDKEAYNQTRARMLWSVDDAWKFPATRFSENKETTYPPPQIPKDAPQTAPAELIETVSLGNPFAETASRRADSIGGFASGPTEAAKPATVGDIPLVGSLPRSPAGKAEATAGGSTDADKPGQFQAEAPDSTRKLIRNASVELEVTGYDTSAQSVAGLARSVGGYVATQNSSRLPNGKMSGAIVLKVPPPALDGFLKQLRTLGDIRNQSIGTQDVTKAYFDTEARMKNARVMEQRLVELLRDTKGKVSDLLEVERELGRVREQIEQMQGELKLWDSLVAYATVNVQLFEKDMNEAAAYLLRERATLSLATTDVEAAFAEAKKVAADGEAQITQSNVTRDGAGNANAVLGLVIQPDAGDATIERLKALGSVLDFRRESQRVARDGSENAPNAKVDRAPIEITVSIRSQDQSPAQRTQLRLETNTVEQAVAALRKFAADHAIEIRDSSFSQQPDGRQIASLRFAFPLDAGESLLAEIRRAGAVRDLSVQRNDAPEAASVVPRAEVSLTVVQPPQLVPDENGFAVTLRRTFAQAVAALAWSVRMIGVAIAFLAPWLLAAGAAILAVKILRRRAGR